MKIRTCAGKTVRLLRRISFVLLCLLAVNYLASRFSSADFGNMDGNTKLPTVATTLGRTNVAFILNRSGPLLWFARETKGSCLPLVRSGNSSEVLVAMFSPRWTHGGRMQHSGSRFLAKCVSADVEDDAGNAVTWQVWFAQWLNLAMLFGILPACAWLAAGWKRLGKFRRHRRAARLRNWRQKLTLCACGYDLRETRSRCPECGRSVRWVPLSLSHLRRRKVPASP